MENYVNTSGEDGSDTTVSPYLNDLSMEFLIFLDINYCKSSIFCNRFNFTNFAITYQLNKII